MEQGVATSWQAGYVAVSYGMAFIGALSTLSAAGRIRRRDGSISVGNTIAGGIALGGISVWTMHFVGMLALQMDVAVSYAMLPTLLSLLAAVAGSALALAFVAYAPHRPARVIAAGVVLGAGVMVVHYLGMYGMRIPGYIRWDYRIVALSAVIGVTAASAALWLAFHVRGLAARAATGLVMAAAVCAFHYTGMLAADYVCTTPDRLAQPWGFAYVSAAALPNTVVLCAMVMALLITLYLLYQAATQGPEHVELEASSFSG
jgi:NO-binding membrane sensor protein with MHYT domain